MTSRIIEGTFQVEGGGILTLHDGTSRGESLAVVIMNTGENDLIVNSDTGDQPLEQYKVYYGTRKVINIKALDGKPVQGEFRFPTLQ